MTKDCLICKQPGADLDGCKPHEHFYHLECFRGWCITSRQSSCCLCKKDLSCTFTLEQMLTSNIDGKEIVKRMKETIVDYNKVISLFWENKVLARNIHEVIFYLWNNYILEDQDMVKISLNECPAHLPLMIFTREYNFYEQFYEDEEIFGLDDEGAVYNFFCIPSVRQDISRLFFSSEHVAFFSALRFSSVMKLVIDDNIKFDVSALIEYACLNFKDNTSLDTLLIYRHSYAFSISDYLCLFKRVLDTKDGSLYDNLHETLGFSKFFVKYQMKYGSDWELSPMLLNIELGGHPIISTLLKSSGYESSETLLQIIAHPLMTSEILDFDLILSVFPHCFIYEEDEFYQVTKALIDKGCDVNRLLFSFVGKSELSMRIAKLILSHKDTKLSSSHLENLFGFSQTDSLIVHYILSHEKANDVKFALDNEDHYYLRGQDIAEICFDRGITKNVDLAKKYGYDDLLVKMKKITH